MNERMVSIPINNTGSKAVKTLIPKPGVSSNLNSLYSPKTEILIFLR